MRPGGRGLPYFFVTSPDSWAPITTVPNSTQNNRAAARPPTIQRNNGICRIIMRSPWLSLLVRASAMPALRLCNYKADGVLPRMQLRVAVLQYGHGYRRSRSRFGHVATAIARHRGLSRGLERSRRAAVVRVAVATASPAACTVDLAVHDRARSRCCRRRGPDRCVRRARDRCG